MSFVSVLLLALALSADAFAVAVGKGVALRTPRMSEALRIGLVFGTFQGAMPVIGWALGSAAERYVAAWDHWLAFVLLGGLGLRMIYEGLTNDPERGVEVAARHGWWVLMLAGLATSIDALVAGVTLAFAAVDIWLTALAIGLVTFAVVTAGVLLGHVVGIVAGKRAEVAGGILLVAMGGWILAQHLGAAA